MTVTLFSSWKDKKANTLLQWPITIHLRLFGGHIGNTLTYWLQIWRKIIQNIWLRTIIMKLIGRWLSAKRNLIFPRCHKHFISKHYIKINVTVLQSQSKCDIGNVLIVVVKFACIAQINNCHTVSRIKRMLKEINVCTQNPDSYGQPLSF